MKNKQTCKQAQQFFEVFIFFPLLRNDVDLRLSTYSDVSEKLAFDTEIDVFPEKSANISLYYLIVLGYEDFYLYLTVMTHKRNKPQNVISLQYTCTTLRFAHTTSLIHSRVS